MFEPHHVDSLSAEVHAFELEACPLFACCIPPELYLSAGTHYAMPWQLIDGVCAQEPGNGSMILRVASRSSDVPVCAHRAGGNRKDDAAEGKVALFIRA